MNFFGGAREGEDGCRIPDAGYRMPDAGYQMPDTGCRMPAASGKAGLRPGQDAAPAQRRPTSGGAPPKPVGMHGVPVPTAGRRRRHAGARALPESSRRQGRGATQHNPVGPAASRPGQSPVGRDSVEPDTVAVRSRLGGAFGRAALPRGRLDGAGAAALYLRRRARPKPVGLHGAPVPTARRRRRHAGARALPESSRHQGRGATQHNPVGPGCVPAERRWRSGARPKQK